MEMDNSTQLEEQIRRLSRTIEEMRERMSRLEGQESQRDTASARSNRRGFLRLGAGAALGALGVAAAKVIPAAAADTAPVVTGATVTGEHPTIIQADAATALPVFAAELQSNTWSQGVTGTFEGPLQGHGIGSGPTLPGVASDGVDGWAGSPLGFGVYGLSDAGFGVVGESSTGVALYARSSGRILQDPLAPVVGPPTQLANDFEQVRDANGLMWISTVTPNVWKQVATTDLGMHIFPNPRRVWDGFAHPTTPGIYGPIDATQKASGGSSGVPAGAQAAWCAVQAFSAGVMTVYPDLTADTGVGNWASTANGPLNLLYMFVPLSPAGKFKFHAYFTGAKFFDVWGYLL
jgi:hypothetical protein